MVTFLVAACSGEAKKDQQPETPPTQDEIRYKEIDAKYKAQGESFSATPEFLKDAENFQKEFPKSDYPPIFYHNYGSRLISKKKDHEAETVLKAGVENWLAVKGSRFSLYLLEDYGTLLRLTARAPEAKQFYLEMRSEFTDRKDPDAAAYVSSLYALELQYDGKTDEAIAWLKQDAKIGAPNTYAQKYPEQLIEKLSKTGSPAQIRGAKLGGGTVDIASLSGSVVAVDYWASWCAPCLQSIPRMKDLLNKHRAEKFEILGVNIDEDVDAGVAAEKANVIPWPSVHDSDGKCQLIYKVAQFPTVILVGRDGNIAQPVVPNNHRMIELLVERELKK